MLGYKIDKGLHRIVTGKTKEEFIRLMIPPDKNGRLAIKYMYPNNFLVFPEFKWDTGIQWMPEPISIGITAMERFTEEVNPIDLIEPKEIES